MTQYYPPRWLQAAEVSLSRFYQLEREFHVITNQIAHTKSVSDREALKTHRNAIVVEARAIVRRMHVAKPNWCYSGLDP